LFSEHNEGGVAQFGQFGPNKYKIPEYEPIVIFVRIITKRFNKTFVVENVYEFGQTSDGSHYREDSE
jgi:hypothetical protein